MENNTCHFDCANPPRYLTSNTDITGVGVSLAYTLTAGFSVGIVLAYYILVYHPDVHSCAIHGATTAPHKQRSGHSPIDDYLLFWKWKAADGTCNVSGEGWNRTRAAFEHCMLLLSDLQLITGLAIIVSGFAQLRCGISAYHWQRIVQLAWFSSITHLCCLTFLRDYLHQHKSAQVWRIPGMVALVVMVIAALVPTAHYAWELDDTMDLSRPLPYDHAICFWNHHHPAPKHQMDFAYRRQRTVISAILLGLGMLNRMWRLYQAPTVAFSRVRLRASTISLNLLQRLHDRSTPDLSSRLSCRSVKRALLMILVYRPMLTMFLTARLGIDIYTSMAFEVWWLLVSFTWGTLALWRSTGLIHEPGSQDWGFGQTVALLVLAAPVTSLIEGYLHFSHTSLNRDPAMASHSPSSHTASPQATLPSTTLASGPPLAALNDPRRDFYTQSRSFKPLVYAGLCTIISTSVWNVTNLALRNYGIAFVVSSYLSPFFVSINFVACTLVSLVTDRAAKPAWPYVQFLLFMAAIHCPIWIGVPVSLPAAVFVYVVLSVCRG